MRAEADSAATIVWHPRLAALRSELQLRRAILRAAIDAIPSAVYDVRPAPDSWSIAGVVEHLARTQTGIAALVRRSVTTLRAGTEQVGRDRVSGISTEDADRLVDRTRRLLAPETLHPRDELGFEAAWAALLEADRKLDTVLVSGNGLPLEHFTHPHPALGPIDVYEWIAFLGWHELRHADQIREIGERLAAGAPPV